MKNLFFFASGFFIGIWFNWPGIVIPENWECVSNIISDSQQNKTSFKAIMAVSPKFLLDGKKKKEPLTRLRVVGDACFR
tara:strand:- start:1846 stop:2082 length:237 start_codon:yes stop_codon:yes gene_type:complete